MISNDCSYFVAWCCFFLTSSTYSFFWSKSTFHVYSQSDYHLIFVANIHRYYLNHISVCIMLKILYNKKRLEDCLKSTAPLNITY